VFYLALFYLFTISGFSFPGKTIKKAPLGALEKDY